MKYGNFEFNFQECDVKYEYSDSMLDEIIGIYNDVTYGKEYKQRCNNHHNQSTLKVSDFVHPMFLVSNPNDFKSLPLIDKYPVQQAK